MSTLPPEGKFDMKKSWLSKLLIYSLFILATRRDAVIYFSIEFYY